MNDHFSQMELDALKAASDAKAAEKAAEENKGVQIGEETAVATPPANDAPQAAVPPVAEEQKSVTTETPEIKNDPPPVQTKSFEEELFEKLEGRFRNIDELKTALTPKEELKFANADIKKLNELLLEGADLNIPEFFELQNKNYDTHDDPKFYLGEEMKYREGLSERTLKVQLNKKYNLSEWENKEDEEMTDEDYANREIMLRDAKNAQKWLQDFKTKRTIFQKPDEAQLKEEQRLRDAAQSNWENHVDDKVVPTVTQFSIVVDDKTNESFNYKFSETDRKEIGNIMKNLTKGSDVLWKPFEYVDHNGAKQINHQKVFESLLKSRVFDDAVKNAYRDGLAEGRKTEVKDTKNVNFNTVDGKSTAFIPRTEAEAIAFAIKNKNIQL